MGKILTTVFALIPTVAFAGQPVIELTPFVGYRWGGGIDAADNLLVPYDVEASPSSSFGLALGFPIGRHFQMELLFDHQPTDLGGDHTLFEPDHDSIGMDITYYHLGFIWQFPARNWRPYIVVSAGIADLDPALAGVRSEQRFSAGLGGGFKLDVSEHVGFRFEGRTFWANTDDGGWWDWDCDHHHCWDWDWDGNNDLVQTEISAGIVLSF